ncbi:unnamed protein product [Rotaria socialis]|uniref:Uncharacterized protein n=1 Tax=Rotaria socialis TaxID=392032 RepID=A0A817S0F0_9BILA|nr:unnamed protein product [Rotaria socialis]CAF3433305.1 unnamed protein product [Rotaria socialis]
MYDTPGLSESGDGSVSTAEAFIQLVRLAYSIPTDESCEKRMPCLLVVTKCDNDRPLDSRWNDNKDLVRNQSKFEFIDCACASTLKTNRRRPNHILDDYTESRCNLIQAIKKHSLSEPMPMDSWKCKALIYARSFYNTVLQWLGFEQNSSKCLLNLAVHPKLRQEKLQNF